MVQDSQFTVGFLDFIVSGFFLYAKDLVEVFPLCFFELELGVSDIFIKPSFLRVRLLDRLVLPYRSFPVSRLPKRKSPGFAGFSERRIESQRAVAV